MLHNLYDGDFTDDLSTIGGVTYIKHDDFRYNFTEFWLLGNAHCAVQTNTDELVSACVLLDKGQTQNQREATTRHCKLTLKVGYLLRIV